MIHDEWLTILVFFWQAWLAAGVNLIWRLEIGPVWGTAACQFGLPPPVTIVILPGHETCLTLKLADITKVTYDCTLSPMSNPKPPAKGADWTQLLADPDLLMHLGELLQAYRDAPPTTRDQALLEMMGQINRGAAAKVPRAQGDPPPLRPHRRPSPSRPAPRLHRPSSPTFSLPPGDRTAAVIRG